MILEIFSNWNLIRTSGFLAYFLLTFSIAAGLMQKMPPFQNQKHLIMELHNISGWTAVLTVVFHGVLLLVNQYVPYEIEELFIPFTADHAPVFSALGTISFYLFLMVMATSDFFMQKMRPRLWKKIHLLVIPAWVLAILHGVFIGTDSDQLWAIASYCGGIMLITILLIFRFFEWRLESTNRKKQVNIIPD